MAHTGEFELLVLLAILRLETGASGPAISAELEEKASRSVSRGALYSSLDRLESKGFLTWRVEGSTPERGGHPSRLFSLTEEGLEALREHQQALRNLTEGLEGVFGATFAVEPDPNRAAVLIRRHIEKKRAGLNLPALNPDDIAMPEAELALA